MKKILSILFMIPAIAFCTGHDQGSGGDGFRIGNKLYSLDLVEAGVQSQAYFDLLLPVDPFLLERLQIKFANTDIPTLPLAQKLTEVYQMDPLLAYTLANAMEMHQWRFVDSALIDINDEQDSDLQLPKENLVQLASRKESRVSIDRSLWNELDEINKVALILHEALYAIAIPQDDGSGYKKQWSSKVREVNGYFFTSDLSYFGYSGLRHITQNHFVTDFLGPIILESKSLPSQVALNMAWPPWPYPFTPERPSTITEKSISTYVDIVCKRAVNEQIPLAYTYLGVETRFILKYETYTSLGDNQKSYISITKEKNTGSSPNPPPTKIYQLESECQSDINPVVEQYVRSAY